MRVAVACDHAGFPLKADLLKAITDAGHEYIDLGTYNAQPVDFPDFALKLADAILSGKAERGIMLCGSGVGACIAANKIDGIYASVCHDAYSAAQGVQHDNMNVLCLGGRVIGPALVPVLVKAFLEAKFFNEEPFIRRVNKVYELEKEHHQEKE